jgi:hypothetical protein
MCDAVTLSVLSTVVGAVGTVGSGMAQQSAAKQQADEVALWQEKQKKFRQEEQARQEAFRQQAAAAQQKGAEELGGEQQAARQAEEEARLSSYLRGEGEASTAKPEAGAAPSSADAALLAGQQAGGEVFQTDVANKLNKATENANQSLGALATIGSYNKSSGGLGQENPFILAESGQGIDKANEFRRGSLGAFGLEKAIEPVQVTYQPSPLSGLFSAALSLGSQGLGSSWGSTTQTAANAVAKTKDPWAGLRDQTVFF